MWLFFVVSGIDGAGKSTLIAFLENKFEGSGEKLAFFYTRIGFTPGIKKLKHFIGIKEKSPASPHSKKQTPSKSDRHSLVKHIYRMISLFDFMLTLIRIRLSLFFGNKVIVDRYVEDNRIIDQEKHGQHSGIYIFLWKLITLIAKKPDVVFFLSIPPQESFRRIAARSKREIEESLETLETRTQMYKTHAEYENWCILDATRSPKEIQDITWETMRKYL